MEGHSAHSWARECAAATVMVIVMMKSPFALVLVLLEPGCANNTCCTFNDFHSQDDFGRVFTTPLVNGLNRDFRQHRAGILVKP